MRLILLLIIINSFSFAQQKYDATWESLDSRPIPEWFKDAKFGIFIHWGVYSVPAWAPTECDNPYELYAEWYWYSLNEESRVSHKQFLDFHNKTYGTDKDYTEFAQDFNCDFFEPDKWAQIIKNSGAKYVVLTSKHHEGFCLWPSKECKGWNAVDIGPQRDVLGDLTKSVKNAGIKMGFYYSLYEWYNPLYHEDVDSYVSTHLIPQIKDLVSTYEPDIFWPDGEWLHPHEVWKSKEIVQWLYNESPSRESIVINDRWGKECRGKHGGFWTTEYDLVGEENVADATIDRTWEECRGIGTSFGYNRNEDLENYSTSEELIEVLVQKVSRGGNLLLNIGPTADGRIPVIMQQRLKDIGDWLAVNGEAIYGSEKWKYSADNKKMSELYFTQKGKDLYAIKFGYPDKEIKIKNVNNPETVSLLGTDVTIKYKYENGVIVIEQPVITPASSPSNYACVFKIEDGV